jgi:hypothetical protein
MLPEKNYQSGIKILGTMQLSAYNIEQGKYLQTADRNSLPVGYNPFNSCIY